MFTVSTRVSNSFGSLLASRRRVEILSFAAFSLVRPVTSLVVGAAAAAEFVDSNYYIMPKAPYAYHSESSNPVHLDLSEVSSKVSLSETSRQEAFTASRKIQVALIRAQDAVWNASPEEEELMASLETLMNDPAVFPPTDRKPREANLSNRMEDYVRLTAYRHFLKTSCLLPPPSRATDEEYLGGACMGLAQDLQKYGLGRATVRDEESVQAAAQLTSDILDFLLQLDFRNGPLRRKYDGTKWCLRALETLLYELAITSAEGTKEETQKSKKQKRESDLLPNDALFEIKKSMEHRDNLRENLIKVCRDAQKAAKQAIFALHRGDQSKAGELMEQCETCIREHLLPIVEEEPSLRFGSFACVLEEYAEAKLLASWLGPDHSKPCGKILLPSDFTIHLEPEEYVGGLCDLTGEVGRFAVQRGTVRDFDSVQLSLQTNQAILTGLQMMEYWPHGTGKKLDALRTSVEKIQRMLYEMSLSEAAGGRNVKSDIEMPDVQDNMES